MTTPVYDSVAFLASDTFAVFNAAGDSFVSEFTPGLRLRADCGTDGVLFGTVASSSFDAATGRTVVATAMDSGAALTANLAEVLHGNDVPESLCAHAALHAPGGRDALPAASAGVPGLVALANTAETRAGAEAAKAVTPAGLAAAVKGLITTNTTIYVATTGSDPSGDGSSAAPYASIAKALSSIANKLIASGVTVTIKVANGTYYVSNTIAVDHPDADKIRIIGNDNTEAQLSISSIDTANRKFIFSGVDYSSYFSVGDIFRITSGTTANQGAYSVASVEYTSGNTELVANEIIASSVIGGASITVMPANRCVLICSVTCFQVKNCRALSIISGFKIQSSTLTNSGIVVDNVSSVEIYKSIISGLSVGVFSGGNSKTLLQSSAVIGSATGVRSTGGANTTINACGIGSCTSLSLYADNGGFNRFIFSGASNNAGGNAPSPAFGVTSSTNGFNSNS